MKTVLHATHLALGAKMIDFCGWEMPLQYKGMVQEHLNVRAHGGIFDLSHMGIIDVEGKEAEEFLDYLSTNEIASKKPGQAVYTLFCTETGTCLEDLLIFKETDKFFLVVNACNRSKVLAHLQRFGQRYSVSIRDRFQDEGILSVQGPAAYELLAAQFPDLQQLNYMHFLKNFWGSEKIVVARTGYTGELGYEIFAPNGILIDLWEELVRQGRRWQIAPAGLGARDTLRLEMGYALYGHEIDETIYPFESVAGWAVKPSEHDFLGCTALMAAGQVPTRVERGVILKENGIARAGALVLQEGKAIGKVTSGAYSPSLQKAIAIVLLEKKLYEGDSVDIQIRQHLVAAEIVKLPFYKKHTTDEIHRDT